jgi:DNA-binding beta-propeller fold protein YncE
LKKLVTLLFLFNCSWAQSINFDAKGLFYLNDSDFGAFAYSTGIISKSNNLLSDKIGAFQFPVQMDDEGTEVLVSNSALDSYRNIAIKSDNRLCYVLESHGSFKSTGENKVYSIKDTPDGSYVSVIDISNLRKIKPDYRFQVAANPKAISLSKNNEYLAVGAEAYNQELQVFELNEFGKPIRLIPRPNNMGNATVNDILWHPNDDFIVFLRKETKEIGLVKVVRDGPTKKIIRLELVGNTIKMEGTPKSGIFSPDGKYFLVIDAKDELGTNPIGQNGHVFVIKFSFDESGTHALIAKADVQENPAKVIMQPNSNNFLVLNQRRSYDYPPNANTGKSSVSVLQLQSDGNIINKLNYQIEGVMPSGLAFDKSGKNFAVSFMQFLNFGKATGGINFYTIFSGNQIRIEKQNSIINTPKGVHSLNVIEDF